MKRTIVVCGYLFAGFAWGCGPSAGADAGAPTADGGDGSIDAGAVDVDAGVAADAGLADAGVADAGVADADVADADVADAGMQLAPQLGGPCTYGGRAYDDCFVGQLWTGRQRIVDASNTLVLDSSIRDARGGPCLLVRNASSLDLVNLDIEGCDETGIRISNIVDSRDVHIVGGRIRDTGREAGSNGSCITAGQTGTVSHPGLVIDGITIGDCGFDDLDHGIYVQAQDYVIRNVVVGDVTGNGISVRSSGLVENCRVRGAIGPGKARVRYFNDHPCGPSDQVRFVGNDVDYGGISVSLLWSSGNDSYACGQYEITGHGDATVDVRPQFAAFSVVITP